MSEELQLAINAAKTGAKTALDYFQIDLKVEYKKDTSPVTIADKKTEEAIKSFILKHDSKAKFLAEETGGDSSEKSLWIIDPIDGTRSFTRGMNGWCILISKYTKDDVTTGVCYFPILNELYYAQKGFGAYYGNKKLSVSKVSALQKSFTAYGSLKYFKNYNRVIDVALKSATARSPEITYGAVLVASGKMDVCIDGYAKPWDSAPLKVLIEEAGGTYTDLKGKPWSLQSVGTLATNGLLHNEVIEILDKK